MRHPQRTGDRQPFRADVQGLRALAILAVVLYHAGTPAISGGYVGVDVFFVLSGFLITGVLWRRVASTGGVDLADFYARRVRRLLPAATTVLTVTVAVSAVVVSPLRVEAIVKDGLSATFYVANYRFALQGTNYLSSAAPPSPLQHYWSLGVEEQFYLLWPLLIGLAAAGWRGRRRAGAATASHRRAVLALAVLVAVSLALSVWGTGISQPWAFFSLPTRAWELGAGGLVALSTEPLRRLPRPAAALLGWAGLLAVLAAVATFTARTPFPGVAALVPVLGTAAVLAAGARPGRGPATLLGRPAAQRLGTVSYSWYLWHWPVLILAPTILGHPLGWPVNLLLAVGSLGLAFLTERFIERPVRYAPTLAVRPARGLLLGAALMAVAVACAGTVTATVGPALGRGVAPVARLPAPVALRATRPLPTATVRHAPPAPGPLDRARVASAAADAAVARTLAASVTQQVVPANLNPPLAAAPASEPIPFRDGCFNNFTDAGVHPCRYGSPTGAKTVVAFGDSHATMWFPALNSIAVQRGWRFEALGKATCPPVAAPLFSAELGHPYHECETWRAGVLARIRVEHPALVVLDATRNYGGPYQLTSYSRPWVQGLATMVARIRRVGPAVVVLGPIPQPSSDVPYCLAAHLNSATACNLPIGSINAAGMAAERAAVRGAGGHYLGLTRWFCTATSCPVIVANTLVYRDVSHLTVSYASYLTEPLGYRLFLHTRGLF